MFSLNPGWTKESVLERIKRFNPDGVKPMNGEFIQCVYESSNGKRCAIGAFIPDGHPGLKFIGPSSALIETYPDLKQYMPLNIIGLNHLQRYHDETGFNGFNSTTDSVIHFLRTLVD